MSEAAAGASARGNITCSASRIVRAAKHERRLRRQIAHAFERGDQRAGRKLIRAYQLSYDAKLAAAGEVNKKRDQRRRRQPNGDFGEDRRLPFDRLSALATRMDMFRACRERVIVKSIPKASGGHRLVNAFGIEHKARQLVLKRVLDLFRSKISDRQFLLVGREGALREAARAISSHGYRFAAELDVADQFGSFNQRELHKFLPELPARSVGANLVPAGMIFDHRKLSSLQEKHTRRLKTSRQGLPAGASTSSVVAEMLMARVLAEIPWETLSQVTVLIYADNVLVLGPTEASVLDACECLSDRFGRSAVGSLRLVSRGVKRLSKGVEFLGMEISSARGTVGMTVPARKRRALIARLHVEWIERPCVHRVRNRLRSYAASASLDRSAAFSAAIVEQALTSMRASRQDLTALEKLTRRSTTPHGGLSLSAIMLDRPRGSEWRQVCNSLHALGIAQPRSQRRAN